MALVCERNQGIFAAIQPGGRRWEVTTAGLFGVVSTIDPGVEAGEGEPFGEYSVDRSVKPVLRASPSPGVMITGGDVQTLTHSAAYAGRFACAAIAACRAARRIDCPLDIGARGVTAGAQGVERRLTSWRPPRHIGRRR